ncbi:MAG: glycosyltransferase, partial [Hyphomicrobiales bacterium]|nr:glycosyltransferase [Hyphomicrobiales bacterium]
MRLCVVAPTYNESGNVAELARRVAASLGPSGWELVFVDDNSPDGTIVRVREIGAGDPRVRGILRIGRRGLSGAALEGMLSTAADCVAVIDADLQHDETLLPKMLDALESGRADLGVGTRYAQGGAAGGLSRTRESGSRFATTLAKRLLGVELSDPMSGFFMLKRTDLVALAPRLSPDGFKILLDLAATAGGKLRVAEVPYEFRARNAGESKMDANVVIDFLGLLLAKATRDAVPVRFLFFVLVGAFGLLVQLAAFLALRGGMAFEAAQAGAVVAAMTANFFLNNAITYRSQRLRGRALVTGLLRSYVAWGLGAVANLAVATWLHGAGWPGPLASVAGGLMGAVWNFAVANL